MSALSIVRRGTRLGLGAASALAFLPPLLTRLVMGQAFFLTGRGKLANFAGTVDFFAGLGIPAPELNAAFVSRLEFYGGIALVVGLLTRLVAAGLATTMVVALATADRQSFLGALWMTGEQGLTDVVPFVYLLFLAWLAIAGPGPLSLDALVKRCLRLGGAPAASEAGPPPEG
ncbi:MAG TPA: DoxX family protein [Vicinamibacteria bacterium]|nr:DoxX family protein [Vicinamibacteria bacterium]